MLSSHCNKVVGPRRGGFLAALVLGSAQVQLPADIREAFPMAGFSHALAASGFHLSVLLGSVLPVPPLAALAAASPGDHDAAAVCLSCRIPAIGGAGGLYGGNGIAHS